MLCASISLEIYIIVVEPSLKKGLDADWHGISFSVPAVHRV